MKILNPIITGSLSTLKLWRGILITWLVSLILVSVLMIPLKGALNNALGNSIITEKLSDGFNPELFTDLGPVFKALMSFFSAGLMMLILVGFLVNIFLTGGLFSGLRKGNPDFSASEFFRSSAKHFRSYLIISVIMRLIMNTITFLIIAVPLIIISTSDSLSYKTSIIIASVSGLLCVIVIPVLLLVVDYARAWQASNEKFACFRAIGFGFRTAFVKLGISYPVMLILLLIQLLFTGLVILILVNWKPQTGGGVFLLFIVSQLLLTGKIGLKVWRYGSITALMEQIPESKIS
jgi:hypothetical protein